MKLLLSALFLLLVVPTCRSSTLEDTCRSFAASQPSIGYDYCIKIFQADEASAAADARGLAAIAARIAEAKANATAARVAALSALEREAGRRARHDVCVEVYADAMDQFGQAADDIAGGVQDDAEAALRDAVTQLSAALDAPGTCEDAFGEDNDTSPLAAEDAEFKKLATIALAVAASLTPPPPSSTPRLPPPAPPLAVGGVDPLAANIPPSFLSPPPPSPSSSSLNLSPSLLIIAALLAFVFCASVSIHLLLRCLARGSSQQPAPSPYLRARRASDVEAGAESARPAAAGREQVDAAAEVVDDEKERLIASLPLFTMASALAALPKSSPDCAVCLSPFTPDAELRLLPACRHAFHAACVDAWLRTTPSCPLCRAAVSLPHPPLFPAAVATGAQQQQEPLDAARGSSSNNSRSFSVEIGSVSNRRPSSAAGDDRRTYSLGSFDYRVDEEVEAVVARIARPAAKSSTTPAAAATAQLTPAEALAEAAGSRGWLREYVDRLASSASSLSGRWSARWSQGHHSHRRDDSWRWDPEAASPAPRAPDEEEPGFVTLYRWIVGV